MVLRRRSGTIPYHGRVYGSDNRPIVQPVRCCPECGQEGRGPYCHHWDAAGERKVPTVPR